MAPPKKTMVTWAKLFMLNPWPAPRRNGNPSFGLEGEPQISRCPTYDYGSKRHLTMY